MDDLPTEPSYPTEAEIQALLGQAGSYNIPTSQGVQPALDSSSLAPLSLAIATEQQQQQQQSIQLALAAIPFPVATTVQEQQAGQQDDDQLDPNGAVAVTRFDIDPDLDPQFNLAQLSPPPPPPLNEQQQVDKQVSPPAPASETDAIGDEEEEDPEPEQQQKEPSPPPPPPRRPSPSPPPPFETIARSRPVRASAKARWFAPDDVKLAGLVKRRPSLGWTKIGELMGKGAKPSAQRWYSFVRKTEGADVEREETGDLPPGVDIDADETDYSDAPYEDDSSSSSDDEPTDDGSDDESHNQRLQPRAAPPIRKAPSPGIPVFAPPLTPHTVATSSASILVSDEFLGLPVHSSSHASSSSTAVQPRLDVDPTITDRIPLPSNRMPSTSTNNNGPRLTQGGHVMGRKPGGTAKRWKAEDDKQLGDLFSEHGWKWEVISEEIGQGRTPRACKERWNKIRHKQKAAEAMREARGDLVDMGGAGVGGVGGSQDGEELDAETLRLLRAESGTAMGQEDVLVDPLIEGIVMRSMEATMSTAAASGSGSKGNAEAEAEADGEGEGEAVEREMEDDVDPIAAVAAEGEAARTTTAPRKPSRGGEGDADEYVDGSDADAEGDADWEDGEEPLKKPPRATTSRHPYGSGEYVPLLPNPPIPFTPNSVIRGRRTAALSELAGKVFSPTGKERKVHGCPAENCGAAFKRSEHLKRHYKAVHMGQKPFPCEADGCEKSFSRKDNLQQHMAMVHHLRPITKPAEWWGDEAASAEAAPSTSKPTLDPNTDPSLANTDPSLVNTDPSLANTDPSLHPPPKPVQRSPAAAPASTLSQKPRAAAKQGDGASGFYWEVIPANDTVYKPRRKGPSVSSSTAQKRAREYNGSDEVVVSTKATAKGKGKASANKRQRVEQPPPPRQQLPTPLQRPRAEGESDGEMVDWYNSEVELSPAINASALGMATDDFVGERAGEGAGTGGIEEEGASATTTSDQFSREQLDAQIARHIAEAIGGQTGIPGLDLAALSGGALGVGASSLGGLGGGGGQLHQFQEQQHHRQEPDVEVGFDHVVPSLGALGGMGMEMDPTAGLLAAVRMGLEAGVPGVGEAVARAQRGDGRELDLLVGDVEGDDEGSYERTRV